MWTDLAELDAILRTDGRGVALHVPTLGLTCSGATQDETMWALERVLRERYPELGLRVVRSAGDA